MENLSQITYDSINKYFEKLKYSGYLNTADTHKLLILSFIEEILYDKFSYFIDEKDYNTIMNTLIKLYGSSTIIGMPSYDNYSHLIHDVNIIGDFRIQELGSNMFSNANNIRIEV